MTKPIASSRQGFSLIPNRRQYVLMVDAKGYPEITPIVDQLQQKGWSFELHFFGESDSLCCEAMETWLSRKKIGTVLYIAGEWKHVDQLIRVATRAGFTDEEMQVKGFGIREKRVFCARCHTIQPVTGSTVVCKECGETLEVSTHYSRWHDAWYGYVVIP